MVIGTLFLLTACSADSDKEGTDSKVANTETKEDVVTITALNVGKADCFIIESPQSVGIMDTGTEESATIIEDYLNKEGITHIDILFISHFDKDHVGGADHIIRDYDVDNIYTTYYEAKTSQDIDEYHDALEEKNITPVLVDKETEFTVDNITWTIYPPEEDDYTKDISNNSSIVVRMEYDNNSMLFTGDAEKLRIKELLEIEGLQSDVLKMPHHGGDEKNLEDLIEYVEPEYAVITSSEIEREDTETMDKLEENGVETYLTRNGNIIITMDGNDIMIRQ